MLNMIGQQKPELPRDFSQTMYSSGPNAGRPVQLYDPFTGLPMSSNISGLLNSAAQGLLNYIPLPNQPGQQNFRYSSSADTSSDTVVVALGAQRRQDAKTCNSTPDFC